MEKLLQLWIFCGMVVVVVGILWKDCCDCGYFVERLFPPFSLAMNLARKTSSAKTHAKHVFCT